MGLARSVANARPLRNPSTQRRALAIAVPRSTIGRTIVRRNFHGRVRSITSAELPPDLAEIYERFAAGYGPFRNQVAVFAHVPAALRHLMSMLMELRAAATLPKRYLEIAIVVVSKLNECRLLRRPPQAVPRGRRHLARRDRPAAGSGQSRTRRGRPPRRRIRPGRVGNPEPHPRQPVPAAAGTFLRSPDRRVTLRITLCGFFNRFNDALRIEEETEAPRSWRPETSTAHERGRTEGPARRLAATFGVRRATVQRVAADQDRAGRGSTPLWFAEGRAVLSGLTAGVLLLVMGRFRLPTRRRSAGDVRHRRPATRHLFRPGARVGGLGAGRPHRDPGEHHDDLGRAPVLDLPPRAYFACRWVAAGLGLAGVAVLVNPLAIDWASGSVLIGHVFLLGAGLSWSVAIIVTRAARSRLTMFALLPWCFLVGSLRSRQWSGGTRRTERSANRRRPGGRSLTSGS